MSLIQSNPSSPRRHDLHANVQTQSGRRGTGTGGVLGATSPNKINSETLPFHSVKLKPVLSPLKPKRPAPSQQPSPTPIGKNSSPVKPITNTNNNTGTTSVNVKTTTTTTTAKQDQRHVNSSPDKNALQFQQRRDTLVSQYNAKQEQIKHYQQKLSHKQLQLLEIESQLQQLNASHLLQTSSRNHSKTQLDIYKQASIETERQLAAARNSNSPLKMIDLNKTPSPLKNLTPLKHALLSQTSFITSAIDECRTTMGTMGKKASMMFNNGSSDGVTDDRNVFMKPQFNSDKFESLTRQTSQFFDNLLSVRDKRVTNTFEEEEQGTKHTHDSFDIDNLETDLVYEQVDIDDYDSSFD
ncbi:hypothetical protein KGF57_005373 [Candida theae]|uniref:Uncharacterized protein n=1 Tax=Candida theae TaxID=1198502 RepID=A0AAD5FW76_9ASCO|nr:uncharacterized protein KGF57_005373 [Candida theae]KAI5948628.1 hypothetical protein KGF57_005373 [Candida theae]